jgi:hypothetical protein
MSNALTPCLGCKIRYGFMAWRLWKIDEDITISIQKRRLDAAITI